ncbi:hypothetical protein BG004_006793 [Podila humilis]|nr:hypothetical protein BG004_006793 [Podila humilis]
MLQPPKATLLLLFVHGFKGHDHHTFLDFPTRIMTIFTNAKLDLDVESLVYPQYDTRGDFNTAVNNFVDWTQQQVQSRDAFNRKVYTKKLEDNSPGESDIIPPTYVVFIGHSMGGLVAADAALVLDALPGNSPVIGILAFDTPYFGLNHTIFTQAAYERVNGIAQRATGAYSLMSAYIPAAGAAWSALSQPASNTLVNSKDTSRSPSPANTDKGTISKNAPASTLSSKWGWGSIALGVGAVVAATSAAAVVNSRIGGMEYISSHIQFVGILWDKTQLRQRVANLLKLPIGFHCFYSQVQIPATASNSFRSTSRTFIELTSIPSEDSIKTKSFFSPRECSGQDEIEAHMEMFNPSKNYDYYRMGEETVQRIRDMNILPYVAMSEMSAVFSDGTKNKTPLDQHPTRPSHLDSRGLLRRHLKINTGLYPTHSATLSTGSQHLYEASAARQKDRSLG